MKIAVTAFYTDPDVSVYMSHLLDEEISSEVNKLVAGINIEKFNGFEIALSLKCIKGNKKEVVLDKKPSVSKKFGIITYYCLLPSRFYKNGSYNREKYIESVIKGIEQLLNSNGISMDLKSAEEIIKKETLGNSKYNFKGHKTKKFTDEELMELLGRVPK